MSKACCPGSFDPVTNGHLDIIDRASRQFDRVVVAVSSNPSKKEPLFTIDERVAMIREATSHLETVEVSSYAGLTVDFCRQAGAGVLIKGLRAVTDFEYEMQMAQMNLRMGVDTVFMVTSTLYSYLSSSLMKEVCAMGGSIDGLVPPAVAARMIERLRETS